MASDEDAAQRVVETRTDDLISTSDIDWYDFLAMLRILWYDYFLWRYRYGYHKVLKQTTSKI